MSNSFAYTVFKSQNNQYSGESRSIGVLGEEGLMEAYWFSASVRPIFQSFQSSVAVYNHARWSRITTGFFRIVYLKNEQQIAVITIMTKICHIQNLPSKQHLSGCHHHSIVWVKANICEPESYEHS